MRCGRLAGAGRHDVSTRWPKSSSLRCSSNNNTSYPTNTHLAPRIAAAACCLAALILSLSTAAVAERPFPFIDVNNDGVYEAGIDTPIGPLTGEASVISTDQSIVVPAGAVIHFKGSYFEFDAGNSITVNGPLTTQGFIYLNANHVFINARVAGIPDGVGIDANTIDVASSVESHALVSLSAADVHLSSIAHVCGGSLSEIKATSVTMDPGSMIRGNHVDVTLTGSEDCHAEGSSLTGLQVSVTSATGSLYFTSAKLNGLHQSANALFTFVTGGPEINLVGVKRTPKMISIDPSAPNGVVLE
jgi:hypothetical protein